MNEKSARTNTSPDRQSRHNNQHWNTAYARARKLATASSVAITPPSDAYQQITWPSVTTLRVSLACSLRTIRHWAITMKE